MNSSKRISLGAMISVLSIILLYMTTILPTARIFLVSLASFLAAILIIEAGMRTAMISFISTSLLGLLLVPNKMLMIPYVTFLGYYGIVKSHIESLNNFGLEWVIKIVLFNLALMLNYILLIQILGISIVLPFSIWLVAIMMQVLFVIYDYVFSLFIAYYITRFKKYIK